MKSREQIIEEIRQDIIDFANNDTDGWVIQGEYKFPRRAITLCAVGYVNRDLVPEYQAFSPCGLKMINDNQYHSDVWLGAGFDLDDAYNHSTPQSDAMYDAMEIIRDEVAKSTRLDFVLLANPKKAKQLHGMVFEHNTLPADCWSSNNIHSIDRKERKLRKGIIVIPHAGIEYSVAARCADLIITETGGKLSHLVTVSREMSVPVIRIADACSKYHWPKRLSVDFENNTIEVEMY